MTPRQLEVVAAVKQHGSQSAAARALGISVGSIGFVVRKHEQLTGTKLPRGKAGRRPGSTAKPRVAKVASPAPPAHTIERVRFKAGTVSGLAPVKCECGWMGVVDEWNTHVRKPAA